MLPESIPKFLKMHQDKCLKGVYFGAERKRVYRNEMPIVSASSLEILDFSVSA